MADSILSAGLEAAKREAELTAKATATEDRAEGEVSFTGSGPSWAARVWAKIAARRQAKPDLSAGVEVSKRWD